MRIKEALAIKIKNNERVGSVPFGKKVAANKVTLVPNEDEQPIVDTVLKLRREGMSMNAIANELTGKGFLSRSGTPFQAVQISRILDRYAPELCGHRDASRGMGAKPK